MNKLPQISILTREDFNNSNKELNEDIPGNHETVEDYINRVALDINEVQGPVNRIEVNLDAKRLTLTDETKQLLQHPDGNTILAIIHYTNR